MRLCTIRTKGVEEADVVVDGDARVLREDGSPIPGLLAAGSTTGGLEGGPEIAYVGGLAKAVVLGLRAAESTARGF